MTGRRLVDPDALDRIEGLSARYALLTRQLEVLQDEEAAYDTPATPGKVAELIAARQKLKAEVVRILEAQLAELQ